MKNRKDKFIITILILIFLFTFSINILGQEDVIKVDTDLVTIPLTVMDRDGRYITDLRKEDIQIFENGIEQEVALFETTEQPITVFFLLDTSRSMKPFLAELTRSTNSFLNQLRPNDKFIVAFFCEYMKTLQNEARVDEIRKKVKIKLQICGKHTMLYEAVDNTFKKIRKIRGRKAIVLFSDIIDSGITTSTFGFFVTRKDNLKDAEELDAPIYIVRFGTISPDPPKFANKKDYFKGIKEIDDYVRDLTQITGGRHFQLENISNLEETFKKVADELGQQYSLGYYPKNPGKKGERRQIKVKVNVPNVAVRARESYVVK